MINESLPGEASRSVGMGSGRCLHLPIFTEAFTDTWERHHRYSTAFTCEIH
jgi:hypothetical protein